MLTELITEPGFVPGLVLGAAVGLSTAAIILFRPVRPPGERQAPDYSPETEAIQQGRTKRPWWRKII